MDNNHNPDNVVNSENNPTESEMEKLDSEGNVTEDNAVAEAEQNAQHEQNDATEKSKFPTKIAILSALYDYVEIFAISIVAVLFIFTFCARLCKVDGGSMKQTLQNKEMLIVTNFGYTPQQDDIIVFHLSNDYYQEPIVKRVIATEGQTVEINLTDGIIKVNGEIYADEHAHISGGSYDLRLDFNKNYLYKANGNLYFAATVPEGHVFVLGDNRNGSSDSRTSRIGFIDVDTILGKAVLRLSPFTVLD